MCEANNAMSILIKNEEILKILHQIKGEISQKFDLKFVKKVALETQNKPDNTLVTDIDLFISNLFHQRFLNKYDSLNFFSEEQQDSFEFPVIILDPIDGTKELAMGVNECCVSFGIYFSPRLDDPRNFSWIYNPFTDFEISSYSNNINGVTVVDEKLFAFVSRTEFESGLHSDSKSISYYPKGSIALKLALLASGAGNFVISKKPKNIWDIMAGTHICHTRGIDFYQNGSKVNHLSKKIYSNDLVWSQAQVWEKIKHSL